MSSKQPLSLPRRGPFQLDALSSRKEDDYPRFSEEELERARKSHTENLQRSQEASQRQQARLRASQNQADREAHERRRRMKEQQDAYRDTASKMISLPPRLEEQRKRPPSTGSTQTVGSSRTSKVPRQDMNNDILVWQNNSFEYSLVEKALVDGELVPREAKSWLGASCIQDGLTIVGRDGDFYTDGLSSDETMRSPFWKSIIEKITVNDDGRSARIGSDGGAGFKSVGIGTYNAVVKFPVGVLPSWVPDKSVCRFTRPDVNDDGGLKYQNSLTTYGEVDNALFCSMNGIGPELYCVSVFSAPRPCKTLRFCVAVCMQRAKSDLSKSLHDMSTFREGAEAAEACIHLLFKASRLGVAFFDIKPGNMLQVSEDGHRPSYRLTDTDPAFFVRLEGRDWRALLLLNLALLSVHVFNSDHGPVGRGWARTSA